MPIPLNGDQIAQDLTLLMEKAQPGNLAIGTGAQMGQWGGSKIDQERIRDWVNRALALARSVNADNVSITAGWPWGLSLSVTFSTKPVGGPGA